MQHNLVDAVQTEPTSNADSDNIKQEVDSVVKQEASSVIKQETNPAVKMRYIHLLVSLNLSQTRFTYICA